MSLETFEKLPQEKKALIIATGIREFSRKSYQEVGTDSITRQCGISKGLLFHYFGSKKAYYLYCLDICMARLTGDTGDAEGNNFHEILFSAMNRKMRLCLDCREEMLMVNMASRDPSLEIAAEKGEILGKYGAEIQAQSKNTLQKAIGALTLKKGAARVTAEGLYLYIHAVLNRYLLQYQQTPDQFFANSEAIQEEMKEYLDLMLYGICEQGGRP